MILAEDFVFSQAAVARILGISVNLVKKVEVWTNCCFVIVKGRRPRFWKKLDFFCHFADWRRSQSKELLVDRLSPEVFNVVNKKKQSNYLVKIKSSSISCNCEDYKNQIKFLPKAGVCKHGYAVLKSLGIDRLSEYVSNSSYQKALENYHKEKSLKLKAVRTDAYSFKVEDSIFTYYCDLQPSSIKCSCLNYQNNDNWKEFCSHGYAVLRELGFTGNQQIKDYKLSFEWTIQDYMNQEPEQTAEQLRQELEAMNCLFED